MAPRKKKSEKPGKVEKPKKKKIEKYRVVITEQWRDFDTQKEAREFARKVLENSAVYYMQCKKVEVDE